MAFYGDDPDVAYLAKVVGRDPLTDSALIQLTEKPKRELTEVKFGDSAQMQPGDWVMAIGNPFGLAHTVSVGVISATERPFPITDGRSQDVLQTDAAINPGNSGGPLLNVRGEVVGMNTAIYTDSRQQGNIGIGFAIPINTVRELLPQLRTGKVTRGVIGVAVGTDPADALEQLGLKERAGALVVVGQPRRPGRQGRRRARRRHRRVQRQAGAATATSWSAMVVTHQARHRPCRSRCCATRWRRRSNVTVDELNLEAEDRAAARRAETPSPTGAGGEGFGMTMSAAHARHRAPAALPAGTAGRGHHRRRARQPGASAPASRRGDVLLQVNRRPVAIVERGHPRARAGGRRQHGVPADPARTARRRSSRCARSNPGKDQQKAKAKGTRHRLKAKGKGQDGLASIFLPFAFCLLPSALCLSPSTPVEREIKLRFHSAEEAATARPRARRRPLRARRLQHDVLLDTRGWAAAAAGAALRVRHDGGRSLLTYKGPVAARAR